MRIRDGSRWGTVVALAVAALAFTGGGCGSDPAPSPKPPGAIIDPGVVTTGRPHPGGAVQFGTKGPWPVESRWYAGTSGIHEMVVGVTTDEAQNRWIATPTALYLAQPTGGLWRFDEMDGLHLGEITGRTPGPIGWAKYCDNVPVADGAACAADATTWGGGNSAGIRSIVGGGKNEVFVGYQGSFTRGLSCPVQDNCDPLRHSGRVDRVTLNEDGSISVVRFNYFLNWHNLGYWFNRSAYRLAYDHFTNHGTLYAGSDHGVVVVFPDRYSEYVGGGPAGLDAWEAGFIGDHNHTVACVGMGCAGGTTAGHWRGLWVNSAGQLWMAGESNAGLARWNGDPLAWYANGGSFEFVFANPEGTPGFGTPGFDKEPVFNVPSPGDPVNLTAVSQCPDGRTWFGSEGATGVVETVAVWDPVARSFRTFDATKLGLPGRPVQDLVCLPDGRVVIAGRDSGAVVYDPAKNTSKALAGLPSQHVIRLSLDTMVTPAALLVGTDAGAAVLRQVP
jgi:hypothetical protein